MTSDVLNHDETDRIRDLLLGRTVVRVDGEHLRLDDGTTLEVVANEGCGGCNSGWYYLNELNGIDNAITRVEFDYGDTEPEKDSEVYDVDTYYRIFVYADHRRVNLLSVEGGDGNGYYGTGFELLVRPAGAP